MANAQRIMFREACDVVNARHTSQRARAAFKKFEERFLSGQDVLRVPNLLSLFESNFEFRRHPIVSRRYERVLNAIMLDPHRALAATPVTKEGVVSLTQQEIQKAQIDAHHRAWGRVEINVTILTHLSLIGALLIITRLVPPIKAYIDSLDKGTAMVWVGTFATVGALIICVSMLAGDKYVDHRKKKLGIEDIKELAGLKTQDTGHQSATPATPAKS